MVHGRLTKSGYEFLIDKIQRRLASWKNKLLNKAGILALAGVDFNSQLLHADFLVTLFYLCANR